MNFNKKTNWFKNLFDWENRLIFKYKSAPEAPTPGAEVELKHEKLIDAIDNNISLDSNKKKPRYHRFEKGKKDRALLLSILKKRHEAHPENIAGLTKENRNLDLMAWKNSNNADVLSSAETAKKKILRLREKPSAKAKEIYEGKLKELPDDFFDTLPTAWKNVNIENGKKKIDTYLKDKSRPVLTTNEFTDHSTDSDFTNSLTFFRNIQEKTVLKKADLASFNTHKGQIETALPLIVRSIQSEEKNAGIIKNVLAQLTPIPPEKHNIEAKKYLEFLKNEYIPALKEYLKYITAINEYFAVIEYAEAEKLPKITKGNKKIAIAPTTPTEKVEAYKNSLKKLKEDIKKTEQAIELANQESNKDEAEFYKKRLDILSDTEIILQHAYLGKRTGAEAYIQNAYEVIKGGHLNGTETLQVAMEEYMAIVDELKAQGKLPSDSDTRAMTISAAMIGEKGIDGILEIASLNEEYKINPHETGRAFNIDPLNSKKIKSALQAAKDELAESTKMKPNVERAFKALFIEANLNNKYVDFEKRMRSTYKKLKDFYENEAVPSNLISHADEEKATEINSELAVLADISGDVDTAFSKHLTEVEWMQRENLIDASSLQEANEAQMRFNNIKSNLDQERIRKGIPVVMWYGEDKEQKKTMEILNHLDTNVISSLNSIKTSHLRPEDIKIDRTNAVIFNALVAGGSPKTIELIEAEISSGNNERAKLILDDIHNHFAAEWNQNSRFMLEEAAGFRKAGDTTSPEILGVMLTNSKENLLEGIEGLGAIAEANDVNWHDAFEGYWNEGYYANSEKNISRWVPNLDITLDKIKKETDPEKRKKLQESIIAYGVLSYILPETKGNKKFLEDLTNPESENHKNARKVLDALIEDFEKRTKLAEKAREIKTAFNEAVNEKGATVTEKVMGVSRRVISSIFDSGQPIEKRIMYAAAAYLFIFKGVLGKNSLLSKLTKYGGGALLASMLYEDVSQKSILGKVGAESSFEYSKGTILNRMAVETNIKNNDKARYRALDILHNKSIEDTLKWYSARDKFDKRPARKKGGEAANISYYNSLKSSRLVSSSEINSIDPTTDDPETNALIFKDVVEQQLIFFGKKARPNENLDDKTLIQTGYDFLYNHYTQDGLKEKTDIPLVSKWRKEQMLTGDHKPTWAEISSAMTKASDIEKALESSEGLPWLASAFAKSLSWLEDKTMPAWFHMEDWTAEKVDQLKHDFWVEYGPEGWEAIESLGESGANFVREKTGELKVWWGNSESAVRLRRTGDNMWKIVTIGVQAPWGASLKAAEWGASTLLDQLSRIDIKRREWLENERPVTFDLFQERGWGKLVPEKEKKKNELLLINQIANDYNIFGRFESDFLQVNLNRDKAIGILAEPRFMDDPMTRFKINPHEGYINFVGIGPRDNPDAAYQDGITNLIAFLKLKDNYDYIDQTIEEGRLLAQAIRTEDSGLIQKHVKKYVDRFGAYKTTHNGHLVFLHFPFPTNSTKTTYQKDILRLQDGVPIKTKEYVKYKNRYMDMVHGKQYPGNFKKYVNSLQFSTQEHPLVYGYMEMDQASKSKFGADPNVDPNELVPDYNGHYVQQYMKEFNLWTTNEANLIITFALGKADGRWIHDFGENDNKADGLFKEIIKHKEIFTAREMPERSADTTFDTLSTYAQQGVAEKFKKFHAYFDDYFASKSLEVHATELISGGQKFKQRYRSFLIKHLSEKYRTRNGTSQITMEEFDEVTKRFIEEHNGIIQDLVQRGASALGQTFGLADKLSQYLGIGPNPPEKDYNKL